MTLDPDAIDALLPQTQCAQCGFDGCLPYAEAIARGLAPINRCAPGGDEGIRRLAALTARPYAALDPAHGTHRPRVLAQIDETRCIGCTICIQKCPVDAIAGAAKRMHTVIAAECTGCELCVAPCPVDCIALVPMPPSHPAIIDRDAAANLARIRYRARRARLARAMARTRPPANVATADTDAATTTAVAGTLSAVGSDTHKREAIAAALARARARRASVGSDRR